MSWPSVSAAVHVTSVHDLALNQGFATSPDSTPQ